MKKITWIGLIFLVVGCSSLDTPVLEPGIETTRTSLPAQTSTVTVLSPTLTNTPKPAATQTPYPTWTRLPTLSPSDGMETLQAWLQGTDNCLLPCWGGITPGQTSWEEAKHLLGQMAGFSTLNFGENVMCDFGECKEIGWSLFPQTVAFGGFDTKVPSDLIHFISIEIQDSGIQKTNLTQYISLEHILRLYGKPSIVLLNAESDLPDGDAFIRLILVYPDNHFVIKYSHIAKLKGENIVACGLSDVINLYITDDKEQLTSVDAIANAAETKNLRVDYWHKLIGEAMGMTLDEFYETFRKEKAPCITTPVEIWMP